MKSLKTTPFFLITLLCCLFAVSAPSAFAGDRPNLLIMGEDADEDTIPRNSQVFKRVLSALTRQMNDIGFDVYNETAVTMDHFTQGRIGRSEAELLDIGRSVRKPPIDVVVSFKIFARVKNKGYVQKVKAYVEGQMIQVNSGKFLGNFEVKSPNNVWTAPVDCNRNCVIDVVGDYAKILANDLGAVLGEELAFLVDGSTGYADGSGNGGLETDYNLVFDNFSADDMMDIEEYLVIFSGYKSHRPSFSSARRSDIFYRSTIKTAKLQRNLNKMLEQLNLRARITFSGNEFTIEQHSKKGKKSKPAGDGW
jgi:hypothetical protein